MVNAQKHNIYKKMVSEYIVNNKIFACNFNKKYENSRRGHWIFQFT
jgi:hypothetical protein